MSPTGDDNGALSTRLEGIAISRVALEDKEGENIGWMSGDCCDGRSV